MDTFRDPLVQRKSVLLRWQPCQQPTGATADFVGVQIARSPYHLAPVCQRSLKCQVVGDAI